MTSERRWQGTGIEWTHAEWAAFDALVERTETCWLWRGKIGKSTGYGRFGTGPQRADAHVAAFVRANGYRPPIVRHSCDTRACVRPTHLLAGTQHDNLLDATERGSIPKATRRHERRAPLKAVAGTANGNAVLTDAAVVEMRARYAGRESVRSLAVKFGISKSQVHNVVTGASWRHV